MCKILKISYYLKLVLYLLMIIIKTTGSASNFIRIISFYIIIYSLFIYILLTVLFVSA